MDEDDETIPDVEMADKAAEAIPDKPKKSTFEKILRKKGKVGQGPVYSVFGQKQGQGGKLPATQENGQDPGTKRGSKRSHYPEKTFVHVEINLFGGGRRDQSNYGGGTKTARYHQAPMLRNSKLCGTTSQEGLEGSGLEEGHGHQPTTLQYNHEILCPDY